MNNLFKLPFLIFFLLITSCIAILMNIYSVLLSTENFFMDFNSVYSSTDYDTIVKFNWVGFSLFTILENIGLLGINSYTVFLILKRRNYFIRFFILTTYIILGVTLFALSWDYLAFETYQVVNYRAALLGSMFAILLWIPYLKKSKAVKETFVN